MDKYSNNTPTAKTKKNVSENYPGTAINTGDNNKDTECLQKERTKTLNNNPRNNDL